MIVDSISTRHVTKGMSFNPDNDALSSMWSFCLKREWSFGILPARQFDFAPGFLSFTDKWCRMSGFTFVPYLFLELFVITIVCNITLHSIIFGDIDQLPFKCDNLKV